MSYFRSGTHGLGVVILGACSALAQPARAPDTLELPEAHAEGRSPVAPADDAHRLDKETLRRFASLEDALDALPGFRVRRQGGLGGYSELSFRGSRGAAIDVYVDGIRLNQDGDAAPDLSKWPLLWFSSVEARSGFDAGADPGSLARIDLSTESDSGRADVEARAGSFSTAEGAASVEAGKDWRWTFGAEGQTSRNDYSYFNDNGTIYNPSDDAVRHMDNNGYWSRGARIGLKHGTAAGRQVFSLIALDTRKEYPGIFSPDPQAYTRRTDWLGAWRFERFGGPVPWEVGLQARRFDDAYRDPGQSISYLSFESARSSLSGEADARARFPLGGRIELSADGRLRAEETKPTVTPYSQPHSSPDMRRYEAQYGSLLTAGISRSLSADLEVRQSSLLIRTKGVSRPPPDTGLMSASKSGFPFSLRAGGAWSGRAQSLGWTARFEQHAPSSSELLGDNNGVKRNLQLKAEETRSLSAFHAVKRGAWDLQSTVFWNEYGDPIRLGAFGPTSFLRYENRADYRAVGLEASGGARVRFAEASASVTWQDLSIGEGMYAGNQPAYESPVEAHAELFLKPSAGVLIGPLADYRGPYYPGDANLPDSRKPAEWEWGAHAGIRRGPVRLACDARNLSDRRYRDFAYSPRSGRSYSLSLSFTL